MQDAGNFLLSVAQPSNAADKSLALLWLYRFVVLGAPGKSGMEHSMQVLMLVRPRHAGSGRTVLFAAFRPRSVRAALQLCQAYGIRFHAIEVGAHVAHHKISQGGAVNTDSPPWER